jgi:TatA/E family protein of Tat protein translocase
MFGIGMPELSVILVVALVVLGPKRLPEVARSVGKALAELRRQTSDLADDLQLGSILGDESPRKPAKPAKAPAAAAAPTPPDEPPTPRSDPSQGA